ncbi:MAG: hypothetical protein ACOC7P_01370 [Chloroflexota bacterium]
MKRLVGVLLCLILIGSVLFPLNMFGADSVKGPSSDEWFITYQRLPEDIRVILEEYASPAALESIRAGDYPREELIQDWIGQEEFEGDVYPVYHSEGVVYVFRGSGEVKFPDGGTTGVVLSEEDHVTVGEAWSESAWEAMVGEREPPPIESNSRSSSNRIWAGPMTFNRNNTYFGVRAYVNFPQFVDTDFNIYTTHLSFTDGEWFESVVGQYQYTGVPMANFYVSWGSPRVIVYRMTPSSGSHKDARIQTRYDKDSGKASMWVEDLEMLDWYWWHEWHEDATTQRVDLCQEQIKSEPVATETATFNPTYIHKGSGYVGWNRFTGPGQTREDYPLQLSWINWWTFDFRTWCEGD